MSPLYNGHILPFFTSKCCCCEERAFHTSRKESCQAQVLTKMTKSLGALVMLLTGDRALGTCSKVTAVRWMRADKRTPTKPWGPRNAQQLPG